VEGLTIFQLPQLNREVEIVERKGLGHPDTICDALAETLCRNLCRAYRERFGQILHHNVDKGLLVGGRSEPAFGGGRVIKPIRVYLAGRAVTEFGERRLEIEDIAVEGSRAWLRENLHALDPMITWRSERWFNRVRWNCASYFCGDLAKRLTWRMTVRSASVTRR
jgi:S-adenosylmethionine synthetase